jgi:hypothetical protein
VSKVPAEETGDPQGSQATANGFGRPFFFYEYGLGDEPIKI